MNVDRRIARTVLVALGIAGGLGDRSVRAQDPIAYRVSYALPAPDRVSVEIELPRSLPAPRTLVIPRAIPMGYGEVPFDRFVAGVEAFDDEGAAIAMSREDGPRWKVGDSLDSVKRVRYQVDVARMEAETLSAQEEALDSSIRLLGLIHTERTMVVAHPHRRSGVLRRHLPGRGPGGRRPFRSSNRS